MVVITSPSMSEPTAGEEGTPSAKDVIMPSCQPPATRDMNPLDAGFGTFHRELMTRLRRMSNDDKPLLRVMSYHGSLTVSSWNVSPAVLPEESSRLLLKVKDPCTWTPWLICLFTF